MVSLLLQLLTKYTVCTGASAVAQPQINLTAVSAAANAAYDTTLSPTFDYYSNDVTGLLSAFIFEDVGVTAYNGAGPLISDKTLLGAAVGIGLIEGYHAGIVSQHLDSAHLTRQQSYCLTPPYTYSEHSSYNLLQQYAVLTALLLQT